MARKVRLLHWIGAKDNDIKYFKNLYPEKCNKYVEAFGGSFAVVRNAIKLNEGNKYIVNDNDESLYYVYTHAEEYANAIGQVSEKFKDQPCKCIAKKHLVEYLKTIECNDHIANTMFRSEIIRGFFKIKHGTEFKTDCDLFKKIEFSNCDFMDVILKYREDENAFVFLDPPYLFSDNSMYSKQSDGKDMTNIIVDIHKIMLHHETKCKIMLIINDLQILRYIFGDMVKDTYDKTYNISKRKDKHLIICNY